MGLIREPKNVDLIIKSEPWTKDELKQFREIMKKQRERKAKLKGVFFNSAKFFDMEYQVYGDVTSDVPMGVQEIFWQHGHEHKSIRIRYNARSGSVIGFLVMGIRFRQQACQKWINR